MRFGLTLLSLASCAHGAWTKNEHSTLTAPESSLLNKFKFDNSTRSMDDSVLLAMNLDGNKHDLWRCSARGDTHLVPFCSQKNHKNYRCSGENLPTGKLDFQGEGEYLLFGSLYRDLKLDVETGEYALGKPLPKFQLNTMLRQVGGGHKRKDGTGSGLNTNNVAIAVRCGKEAFVTAVKAGNVKHELWDNIITTKRFTVSGSRLEDEIWQEDKYYEVADDCNIDETCRDTEYVDYTECASSCDDEACIASCGEKCLNTCKGEECQRGVNGVHTLCPHFEETIDKGRRKVHYCKDTDAQNKEHLVKIVIIIGKAIRGENRDERHAVMNAVIEGHGNAFVGNTRRSSLYHWDLHHWAGGICGNGSENFQPSFDPSERDSVSFTGSPYGCRDNYESQKFENNKYMMCHRCGPIDYSLKYKGKGGNYDAGSPLSLIGRLESLLNEEDYDTSKPCSEDNSRFRYCHAELPINYVNCEDILDGTLTRSTTLEMASQNAATDPGEIDSTGLSALEYAEALANLTTNVKCADDGKMAMAHVIASDDCAESSSIFKLVKETTGEDCTFEEADAGESCYYTCKDQATCMAEVDKVVTGTTWDSLDGRQMGEIQDLVMAECSGVAFFASEVVNCSD